MKIQLSICYSNMENNPLKQKKCIDNDINEINNFMSAIKSISIKNL
jgi:hypothetical protein